MDNQKKTKGIVGAAVLWLLVALSALGLGALHLARWQKARATSRLNDFRSRLLVAGAAVHARDTHFSSLQWNEKIGDATVNMTRLPSSDPNLVRLRCDTQLGGDDHVMEIGWQKISGIWRAYYWREAS